MIYDIAPANVPFIWATVRPLIEKPLERDGSGRYLPDDVLRFLLDGTVKLWVSCDDDNEIEAAIVTQVVQYPRLSELRIWLIGGRNLKHWGRAARDQLEAFARDQGCTYVSGAMRKGWLRIGGSDYKLTGVSFEKRLN